VWDINMSETVIYQKANTLTLHTLDSFDVGIVKAAEYICQIDNKTDSSFVQIRTVNDGVTITITQQGSGILDVSPLEFSAEIVNANFGTISFTPTVIPTVIVAGKTEILANNYAEHTKCGRLITHSQGFSLNNNNAVVRQANNNRHTFSNTYLVENTLGPINDGPNIILNSNFLDNSAWKPYNDAILSNNQIVTNNIYKNNFIYQEIDLEIGYVYRASVVGNNGKLVVGSTLETNNYIDQELSSSNTGTMFTINTSNTVYFSVGHKQTSTTNAISSYLYKVLPFNTYKYDVGTFYYKWQNVATNTILWTMETFDGKTRELKVNTNGDVQLTEDQSTLIIGPQTTGNNTIAISYGNGFSCSLNANSIVSNLNIQILNNMVNLEFITSPQQFSYVPVVLSNTEVVNLGN
jgi:hypothetical protein